MPIISVIAAGAMGAAVGQRLVENGVEVRTLLSGRSAASQARAQAAGMVPVGLAEIASSDLILSIVPPGEAMALAQMLAPALTEADRPAAYADCNAVSPQTVLGIEAVIAATGADFIDAGIIGGPPVSGGKAPTFYGSGPHAQAMAVLGTLGLPTKLLDAPNGAASGLKMSYAGITKGLTGLASAMMLAATRFGAEADLRAELESSQPNLMAAFRRSVPDMFPKAYRWVAEMEEIAAFAGADAATQQIYQGMAALYQRLADDLDGNQAEIATLRAFVKV